MRILLKCLKWSIILTIFFGLIGILVAGGAYLYVMRDLPELTALKEYHPLGVSEVFDKDNNKVGEFWQERRIVLPYDQIPKMMIWAIISSEDQRFFEHAGIDYWGIFRAILDNALAGHMVQGASTITQQVTKSILLTPERTLLRKVKEAFLAKQIEDNFTKEEILYLYLTHVYFGNRAYGIASAAENYFHKPLKDLTIGEMALIAGMPKAPTAFSPLTNPVRAIERQHYVIDRMLDDRYINKEEAEAAKSTPFTLYTSNTDKDYNLQYAPWFTEHVRRLALEKYGSDKVYKSGLKLYTTLDLSKQKNAEQAVMRGVRALDKRQGYRGARQHVNRDDIAKTCEDLEKSAQSTLNVPIVIDAKNGARIKSDMPETPLENEIAEGVITDIDSATKDLLVCHGARTGIIRHADYKWAKARNLETPGWEDADYVPDPKARFKVGDVIEISRRIVTADDFKKGYKENTLYFRLDQTPEVQGTLVSYDPTSGNVVAMIGGYDFKKSEFNRATQALRQPGSAFKPFIYTAATMKGYRPDTTVNDAPMTFSGASGKPWSPKNYDGKFYGPTPIRTAIARSQNLVAVRLLVDVGTDFVTAITRLMGLTTRMDRYYSMALGANDIYPIELARAYGTFATGGILPEMTFIRRVEDNTGKILEETKGRDIPIFTSYFMTEEKTPSTDTSSTNSAEDVTASESRAQPSIIDLPTNAEIPSYASSQAPDDFSEAALYNPALYENARVVIDKEKLNLSTAERIMLYGKQIPPGYTLNPQVAYTMRELLAGVVEHGTAMRAKALKRPAAGKTGTTNNETDAWFMGFVPQLVTGVWVGFDNRQSIGAKETGGKAALPIWMAYMSQSLEGQPVVPFSIPSQAMTTFYDPRRVMAMAEAASRHEKLPDNFVPTDINKSDTGTGTGPSSDDSFFSSDF